MSKMVLSNCCVWILGLPTSDLLGDFLLSGLRSTNCCVWRGKLRTFGLQRGFWFARMLTHICVVVSFRHQVSCAAFGSWPDYRIVLLVLSSWCPRGTLGHFWIYTHILFFNGKNNIHGHGVLFKVIPVSVVALMTPWCLLSTLLPDVFWRFEECLGCQGECCHGRHPYFLSVCLVTCVCKLGGGLGFERRQCTWQGLCMKQFFGLPASKAMLFGIGCAVRNGQILVFLSPEHAPGSTP